MKITKGFEVEWCSHIPYDEETQSHDFDCGKYHARDFANQDSAMKFAKEIAPKDFFGSVRLTEFALDEFGQKDYFGQPLEVEA